MQRGFSLVELSIVLVILGLLTGGILAGQSLIRAAELRSVVRDYDRYQTAAMTFRDKYFALPGDFNKAQDIWGTDANGCPAGGGATGTCNGDGNGRIDNHIVEGVEAWKQMALSGLIEGSYTGAKSLAQAGINFPRARISNGMYAFYYSPSTSSHVTYLGWADGTTANFTLPSLIPSEAWNLDQKMDDGLPATGMVRGVHTAGYTCHDGTNYVLTTTSLQCQLLHLWQR